jgi:hypothetical protein
VSKQSIHIERLEIRLRGVSAETARASTAHLGQTLLAELAGQTRAAPHTAPRAGDDVAEGVRPAASQSEATGGARDLPLSVARKVAAAVRERLK